MDPDSMSSQHLYAIREVISLRNTYHWLGVKYLLIFWKTGAYIETKNIGVAWRLRQTISFYHIATGQHDLLGNAAADGLCTPSHGISNPPSAPQKNRCNLGRS